jgi:hypothetical protein
MCAGNVNSIHNKWDLTFHIETNFGALSSVLDTLADQIRQHGDTLTKFAERKEMNGNTFFFFQFRNLPKFVSLGPENDSS